MKNKDRGSMTIEATIVVTTSILALFVMIQLGMILYRQSLITATANQTASDIATIYPYLDKDPNTGFTGEYDFSDSSSLYRYFLWKSSKYKNANIAKAQWYANSLIEKGNLYSGTMSPVTVNVKVSAKSGLRRDITVEIIDNYKVPFAEAMEFFGLPSSIEIRAKSSAECVDMIDYMDTSNFLNYLMDAALPFSDLFDAVEKWIDWAKRIIDL